MLGLVWSADTDTSKPNTEKNRGQVLQVISVYQVLDRILSSQAGYFSTDSKHCNISWTYLRCSHFILDTFNRQKLDTLKNSKHCNIPGLLKCWRHKCQNPKNWLIHIGQQHGIYFVSIQLVFLVNFGSTSRLDKSPQLVDFRVSSEAYKSGFPMNSSWQDLLKSCSRNR